MSIKQRIEANPWYWVIGVAFGSIVTFVTIVSAIAAASGREFVQADDYLEKDRVDSEYLPRAAINQQFVPREQYETCVVKLERSRSNAQESTLGQAEEEAARCRERLSSCEAELETARQHESSASQPSVPTNGSSEPGNGGLTGLPANMFRSKWFELEVISVDIGVENISVVAEARVVGDDEIKFRLPKHNTLLLDQGGNRWYAVEDTAGLLGPLIVNLVPGTALRTKFRFFAGHSEKVPEPKPPFTLTSEEDFTDERIVIPGLRPE